MLNSKNCNDDTYYLCPVYLRWYVIVKKNVLRAHGENKIYFERGKRRRGVQGEQVGPTYL